MVARLLQHQSCCGENEMMAIMMAIRDAGDSNGDGNGSVNGGDPVADGDANASEYDAAVNEPRSHSRQPNVGRLGERETTFEDVAV